MHQIYKDTLKEVNDGYAPNSKDLVRGVMITDDINFLGRPGRTIEAFDIFVKHAALAGLVVNPSKTKMLWPHAAPLSNVVLDALDARGIVRKQVLKIFGAPIGRPDLVRKMCIDIVHDHARFWSTIIHPDLPHQHAMLLLGLVAFRG